MEKAEAVEQMPAECSKLSSYYSAALRAGDMGCGEFVLERPARRRKDKLLDVTMTLDVRHLTGNKVARSRPHARSAESFAPVSSGCIGVEQMEAWQNAGSLLTRLCTASRVCMSKKIDIRDRIVSEQQDLHLVHHSYLGYGMSEAPVEHPFCKHRSVIATTSYPELGSLSMIALNAIHRSTRTTAHSRLEL